MKNPSWISLVAPVRVVRDALGVSNGAACRLLCEACASDVRSRKRPWPERRDEPPEPIYDHGGPPIPKAAWHGANIELEHGWLYLAGGELVQADVEINADDLGDWLDADKTESGPVPKRAGKRGSKPEKLEATKKQMRNDLANNRYTGMQLREMKEEALAATYGVSRDTARKARDAVLSGLC